jgi:NADP-dependent 3-hydroxy acid dehydrogenase YdfG
MIACTGIRTTIIEELKKMRQDQAFVRITAWPTLDEFDCEFQLPPNANLFVLAAGVLHSQPITRQTSDEIGRSLAVNLVNVIRLCETILDANHRARIVVIGSQSAVNGCFDKTYFASKCAVHRYVELRNVGANQALFCVAPPIIGDSGMTQRRHDYPEVLQTRRWVSAAVVASRVDYCLFKEPAGRNEVINL